MKSGSPPPQTLKLDAESLGHVQEWTVINRGLEYNGQVIVAETVDAAWGQPLDKGVSFRIVFYLVPRRIPPDQIQDPRIAMAVPGRVPVQASQLGREIRSIREARERYVTTSDQGAGPVHETLEGRENALSSQLAQRFATAFSAGRVYGYQGARIKPKKLFVESSISSWADNLASAVLTVAHPELPFDHTGFPGPLTTDKMEALFHGLFQNDLEATDVVIDYGPGLGLALPENPTAFNAERCPAVAVIRRELEAQGGEMHARELLVALARSHGLTRPLAALFLASFVRQEKAETELIVGHGVNHRDGARFLGDRLTWDIVPEISFNESLADQLETVRLQPSPTWDSVLPYATLLVEGLEPGDVGQESLLLDALRSLAETVDGLGKSYVDIETALGSVPPSVTGSLNKLEELSGAATHRRFLEIAQEEFRGPAALKAALGLSRQLSELAGLIPAITGVKKYLEGMSLGRGHQPLALQRDAVLARIEPESLVASPGLWNSIETEFQRLRELYVDTYLDHHTEYYKTTAALARRLDGLTPQVEAVTRLGGIQELGEPVGGEVSSRLIEIKSALRRCDLGGDIPLLDTSPCCPSCMLPLNEDPPVREAELLSGAVEKAMREYNHRLGSHSVRQVLAHPGKEQLQKFMDLVQVADPSSLANVMDDDVVEFLRGFLRDG